MEEWLSYRPADFLLFSDRAYWRLFELENAALMPLPLALPLATAVAVLLAWFRPRVGIPALAVILAAGWGLTGWSFVWQRYAPINWAAAYLVPLFLLEAILLLGAAATGLIRRARPTYAVRAAGFALLVHAVAVHPFVGVLAGRPLAGAEVIGIAPDPTAIATAGLALLLPAGWRRTLVLIVPAAWLVLSALTLWLLGTPQAAVPAVSLLVAAAALVLDRIRNRRASPPLGS